MERIASYHKKGFWMMVLGMVVGVSVLFHLEVNRSKPSVEYIGKDPMLSGQIGVEPKSEPLGRAPSSFPASTHN